MHTVLIIALVQAAKHFSKRVEEMLPSRKLVRVAVVGSLHVQAASSSHPQIHSFFCDNQVGCLISF